MMGYNIAYRLHEVGAMLMFARGLVKASSSMLLHAALSSLISGCTTVKDPRSVAKDEQFRIKTECEKYAWPTERDEMEREKRFGDNTKGWAYRIDRVFYSESRNTCLVMINSRDLSHPNSSTLLELRDVLTKETVWISKFDGKEMEDVDREEKAQIKVWEK